MRPLPVGKLDLDLLERLLARYGATQDPRVVVGPRVGEDAAVIDAGDRYLVVKTDPITFAAQEIGRYAVQVNANDVAVHGARPRWFQATLLLPEGRTTPQRVEEIYARIAAACREIGASLVGGHTEVTHGLDRPIVVGSMLGEVRKGKLVTTSGARVGDTIILTQGIVIEGTAVIAREKRDELLARGYDEDFIQRAARFLHDPGLSIVEEALLANECEVHAMHDPTEGGLAAGLYEMAQASGTGALVQGDAIPVFPESQTLCAEFGLDPLRTLASGALLVAADPASAQAILERYRARGVPAAAIGQVKEASFGVRVVKGGRVSELVPRAQDELARLFT